MHNELDTSCYLNFSSPACYVTEIYMSRI